DGRLALAVGDVAGKGLAAAQAVGGLRHALRAYGLEGSRSPGEVLTLVDHFAAALGIPDVMATMLLVVLDPRTGRVEWASAGHPPPLCLPADGPATLLEGRPGPPLGVDEEGVPALHHGLLREGDGLLLFTDGLVERRGEALDTGLRRLAAAAAAAGAVPLPVLLDALLPMAPRPLEDDVTTLVVRRVAREVREAANAASTITVPAASAAPLHSGAV
ncbi:MAG TPA: PP2C family protein-serine/threonine phosphatase, partial [Baekduia sp.]|nr:PP2C family protein-serine/threonine phosphatase [Baekduia sp.]